MRLRLGTFRLSRLRHAVLRTALAVYTFLVLFSLLNFKSRVRFEMPTMFGDPVFTINLETRRCHLDLASLGE